MKWADVPTLNLQADVLYPGQAELTPLADITIGCQPGAERLLRRTTSGPQSQPLTSDRQLDPRSGFTELTKAEASG